MSLIHTLNMWDTNLFLVLNGWYSDFFDGFMYAFSAKLTWIPLYLSVFYVVVRRWKRDSVWVVLSMLLCLLIADQVSSGIIKDWVQRPRPTQSPELQGLVHMVNNYRGGRFGFVSSHAANTIGFALLSSLLFKRRFFTIVIFSWAALTAYSRIYLGVHFPLDIIGGSLVGVMSGVVCWAVLRRFRPDIVSHPGDTLLAIPQTFIAATVVGICLYGFIIS